MKVGVGCDGEVLEYLYLDCFMAKVMDIILKY